MRRAMEGKEEPYLIMTGGKFLRLACVSRGVILGYTLRLAELLNGLIIDGNEIRLSIIIILQI